MASSEIMMMTMVGHIEKELEEPPMYYSTSSSSLAEEETMSPLQSIGSLDSSIGSPDPSSPPLSPPFADEHDPGQKHVLNGIPYIPEFSEPPLTQDAVCSFASSWMCVFDLDSPADVIQSAVHTEPEPSRELQTTNNGDQQASFIHEHFQDVYQRGLLPVVLEWLSPKSTESSRTKFYLPVDENSSTHKYRTRRRDRLTPRSARMLPRNADGQENRVSVCFAIGHCRLIKRQF